MCRYFYIFTHQKQKQNQPNERKSACNVDLSSITYKNITHTKQVRKYVVRENLLSNKLHPECNGKRKRIFA